MNNATLTIYAIHLKLRKPKRIQSLFEQLVRHFSTQMIIDNM